MSAYGLLLKLNPQTQKIIIRVDGSTISVSPADVAAALRGVPDISCRIAEASILGSQEAIETVRYWLLAVVIRLSHEQKWKTEYVRKVIFSSIIHRDIFSSRCPTCKGRKEAPDPETHKIVICQDCGGLGKISKTITQKAKCLGISRQKYDRNWKPRETDIKGRYAHYEHQALYAIKENFFS